MTGWEGKEHKLNDMVVVEMMDSPNSWVKSQMLHDGAQPHDVSFAKGCDTSVNLGGVETLLEISLLGHQPII